jgi:hypothetical protein
MNVFFKVNERTGMKKAYLFVILFLFAGMLSLSVYAGTGVKAYAAENIIELSGSDNDGNMMEFELSYGTEGIVRLGRKMYVALSAENTSGAVLDGSFTVRLYDEQNKGIAYSKEVEFYSDGSDISQAGIAVPMDDMYVLMQVLFESDDGVTYVNAKVPLTPLNYGENNVIGVLGKDESAAEKLCFLSGYGCYLAYAPKTDLADADILDVFDILVTDDAYLKALDDEEKDSLNEFTDRGGSLVIYHNDDSFEAGKDESVTAINYINDNTFVLHTDYSQKLVSYAAVNMPVLLGVSDSDGLNEALTSIDTYESNYSYMKEEKDTIKISTAGKSAMDNVYLGSSMLDGEIVSNIDTLARYRNIYNMLDTDGSNSYESELAGLNFDASSLKNIVSHDSVCLLAGFTNGNGNILCFPFDISVPQESLNDMKKPYLLFYSQILFTIKQNVSKTKSSQLSNEEYGTSSEFTQNSFYVNRTTNKKIYVLPYALILAVYVILILPLAFIIFKKIRKTGLFLFTVPVSAVLFSALIFVLGKGTRITRPYTNYMNIAIMDTGKGTVNGNVSLALSYPDNLSHTLSLSGVDELYCGSSSFNTYYQDFSNDSAYDGISYENVHIKEPETQINKDGDDVTLTTSGITAFSDTPVSFSYSHGTDSKIAGGSVKLTENGIEGYVENYTSTDIENVFVYSDAAIAKVGTLKAGSKIDVSSLKQQYITGDDSIYYKKFWEELTDNQDVSDEEFTEYENVYISIKNAVTTGSKSFIIIADTDLAENPLLDVSGMDNKGDDFLLIPLEAAENGDEGFISDISEYCSDSSAGTYNSDYSYLTESAIYETYDLPDDINITSVDVLDFFNCIYDESVGFYGNISLYNYRTDSYDVIYSLEFDNKNKSDGDVEIVISEGLSDYISSDNVIMAEINPAISTTSLVPHPHISAEYTKG